MFLKMQNEDESGCAQIISMFSNIILKFLNIAWKTNMRTNICICVRKVISNARMVWLVFNLTENLLSHLLLFFKAALQLGVSQVSVHLCLSIPA